MMRTMKESGLEQPNSATEKEKEALRHHLSHYPLEAGMPGVEQMAEFALRLGEDISVKVDARQGHDGWYVNLPDGKTSRVATFQENPVDNPPRDLYIVYHSNRTARVGHGLFGAEFQMERVTPPKSGEEAGEAGAQDEDRVLPEKIE